MLGHDHGQQPGHLNDLRSAAQAVVSAHLATDSAPNPTLDRGLWDKLENLGFIGLGADEVVGGSGGDILDATTVLAELTTARVPYAESTLIAAPALSAAGIDLPSGPYTAAQAAVTLAGGRLNGQATRIPFARGCDYLALLASNEQPAVHLIALDTRGVSRIEGANLAGEPRDTVILASARPIASAEVPDSLRSSWWLRCALARAVASSGVASAVVECTIRHVAQRSQFGRPLVKFQVVEHAVAKMTADASAMQVAATAAAMTLLDAPASAEPMVAAAKSETAILARQVAAAAHQAHGAIGFTQEHVLGALTTRLWAWREEYGSERYWQQRLGGLCTGQDLWQFVTGEQ